MDECKSSTALSCPFIFHDEKAYTEQRQRIEDAIAQTKTQTQNTCESAYQSSENTNAQLYQSCVTTRQSYFSSLFRMGASTVPGIDCEANQANTTASNQNKKASCLSSADGILFKYQQLLACDILDTTDQCSVWMPNSHTENNGCVCNSGYAANMGQCTSSTNVSGSNGPLYSNPSTSSISPYDIAGWCAKEGTTTNGICTFSVGSGTATSSGQNASISISSQASSTTTTSGTSTRPAIVLTRDLKIGVSGSDVLQLQTLLQNLHYLGATAPLTGYFGTLTMNAVIAFQKASFISPAQGYVGPLTRKKLTQ
jgi:hypothetical protein